MATLFITLGAPLLRHGGELYIDQQSAQGMHGWRAHFDRIIAATICHDGEPTTDHVALAAAGITLPDFELVDLPDGYHIPTWLRTRRATRNRLREAMMRADYVSFAIGGWVGDWGVEGADVARRAGIRHAVWFDRVESAAVRQLGDGGFKNRLRQAVFARNERRSLRRADLGLLHGRTVFNELAPYSRNPQIVEDIQLEETDRIAPDALADKIGRLMSGPLRIAYAGRAHPMKGGRDWIAILGALHARGIDFTATWAGDGEDLPAMKADAAALGIAERVAFPGFVADRSATLEILRGAHLLLFCHVTDESPRILIEALHGATPLVGYRDPFAAGLVEEWGAGHLVQRGDREGLVGALAGLASDRVHLSDLVTRAGQSARHLTRSAVFAARSNIIKQYLNPLGGKPDG